MFKRIKLVLHHILTKPSKTYTFKECLEAEPKFSLIPVQGKNYYRIKALRSFSDVKKGDLGGYVNSPWNLSNHGDSWVYDDAKAIGSSVIRDDAKIRGNSIIMDNAKVSGDVVVSGECVVSKYAEISGKSKVEGSCIITDNAMVLGISSISGKCQLSGHSICTSSILSNDVMLSEKDNLYLCVLEGKTL